MRGIKGRNMTSFFRRELYMYALGDIKFKTPISLNQIIYTIVLLLVWSLPIVLLFGFHFNVWFVSLILVPPLFLGAYANKPLWNGKSLISFISALFNFVFKEPKGWTDLKSNNNIGKKNTVYAEHEIWISRRREINILKKMLGE